MLQATKQISGVCSFTISKALQLVVIAITQSSGVCSATHCKVSPFFFKESYILKYLYMHLRFKGSYISN